MHLENQIENVIQIVIDHDSSKSIIQHNSQSKLHIHRAFKCHDCKGGSIDILIQCQSSKLEIKTFKFSNTYGQNQYRKLISRALLEGFNLSFEPKKLKSSRTVLCWYEYFTMQMLVIRETEGCEGKVLYYVWTDQNEFLSSKSKILV